MPAAPDRRIGALIDGRYRLLQVLGSGGMGVVYRAEQLLLQKAVALKLLHTHLRSHPRGLELQQRFLREAQSLARLGVRHPHIAPVIDCGVCDDGTLYMAMELLEGEPLCDVIARGPLPPARALHIAVQVLRTLIHAHGHGIVHRDLKPDNIMLTRQDGREDFVKVLDFGIAKLLSEAELAAPAVVAAASSASAGGAVVAAASSASAGRGAEPGAPSPVRGAAPDEAPTGRPALTRAGVIFGTPEYLAPEQAQGQGVDQRADLYAVGCVLWEMLAGRRPFIGTSALEVISMHLTREPEPPSAHSPAPLPPGLDEVVLRAMEKRPEDRFASAEEFLRALDVVLEEVGRPPPRRASSGRVLTPLLEGIRRAVTVEWRAPASRPGVTTPRSLPAARGGEGAGAPAPAPVAERLWDRAASRLGVRGAALLAAVAIAVALLGLVALVVGVQVGRTRRPAAAAVEQPRPAPLPPVPIEGLIDVLERGERCAERRSAALALLGRRDRRALEPLQRARARVGAARSGNGCMKDDVPVLDEVIEKLRASPAGPGIDSAP